MNTPNSRGASAFNHRDYRIDVCDKCGVRDAVPRRARRRFCVSCRLADASERATARAAVLMEHADRAFLARRLLVARIDADRQREIDTRGAGECSDATPREAGAAHCVVFRSEPVGVTGGNRCDTPPPCFKLRRGIKARTAIWHTRDAMSRASLSMPNHGSPTRIARRGLVHHAEQWAASGTGHWGWYVPPVSAGAFGGDVACS